MILPILLLLLAVLVGMAYYFARVVLYPKVFPFEETYRMEAEAGRIHPEKYQQWSKEDFSIPSPYGYTLHAVYHPVQGSRKTIVISHGITVSLNWMIKYAALFRRRGFNILIYDLRHHGLSGGPNTTFGYYEKDDLKVVVDWAFERLGEGGIVGTMGESLGAATTLQHAGIDPRVAFSISDCSYSVLSDLFTFRMREDYHLPPFPLLPLANLFVWTMSGMTFRKAAPMQYIPQIQTPIFFIHGKEDTYIPPKMSIDMYRAKTQGYRKLYLAPNAGHAESYWVNPLEYEQKLDEFLNEVGII